MSELPTVLSLTSSVAQPSMEVKVQAWEPGMMAMLNA